MHAHATRVSELPLHTPRFRQVRPAEALRGNTPVSVYWLQRGGSEAGCGAVRRGVGWIQMGRGTPEKIGLT